MKSTALCLTTENLSEVQAELEQQLLQLDIKEKDILRTQLLVEEIFLRMSHDGHVAQVDVQVIKKFFGEVQVKLSAEGNSYNPLVEAADWNEDDDDYYSMMILKANRQRLNWSHKNNCNVVTIDVRGETNRQLWILVASIVGGLMCGVVMKEIFSPETIELVTENFIVPISTMFFNALSMVIAPMIFFSIISGITGMGSGAGVGRIGTKMLGIYLCAISIAVVVGLTVAGLIFSSDVPQLGTVIASAAEVDTYEFSLTKFIVDIIPADLVNPIANGNMLQIIFIAILFGSCLNTAGDKVALLHEIVRTCNEFFMRVAGMIIFFVPLIVFFAMVMLIIETGLEMLLVMGKLIIGQLSGSVVMLGVYIVVIAFVGKMSPMPFLKKIPSLMPTPFATSSGAVSMPLTMEFCTKRLGISPKVTSFSIPIGTTVNANGDCLYIPVVVIMVLKMHGIDVDLNTMLIIFTMTMALSVGTPAVPNVTVIYILTITETFGVPGDIAGLLFCMDTVCDRICTCVNVTGNTVATLILARTENLFDKKIYFGR